MADKEYISRTTAKEKWTQGVKEKIEERGTAGSFREWCRRRGFSKVTAECIADGLKSLNVAIRKKAGLAKAYATMRKRK